MESQVDRDSCRPMIVFTVPIEKHEDPNSESQHDESQGSREKRSAKRQDVLYLVLSKIFEQNPLKSPSKCLEVS